MFLHSLHNTTTLHHSSYRWDDDRRHLDNTTFSLCFPNVSYSRGRTVHHLTRVCRGTLPFKNYGHAPWNLGYRGGVSIRPLQKSSRIMTGLRNLVTGTYLLMLMLLLMSHTTAGSCTLLGTRRHANVPNKRYVTALQLSSGRQEGQEGQGGRKEGKGREGREARGAWWDWGKPSSSSSSWKHPPHLHIKMVNVTRVWSPAGSLLYLAPPHRLPRHPVSLSVSCTQFQHVCSAMMSTLADVTCMQSGCAWPPSPPTFSFSPVIRTSGAQGSSSAREEKPLNGRANFSCSRARFWILCSSLLFRLIETGHVEERELSLVDPTCIKTWLPVGFVAESISYDLDDTKGHFTHERESRDREIVRAHKCLKAVPRHLRNRVVWSRILECSVKSYLTRPSTKCYSDEFLCMRVLTHDKVEY